MESLNLSCSSFLLHHYVVGQELVYVERLTDHHILLKLVSFIKYYFREGYNFSKNPKGVTVGWKASVPLS